MTVLLTLSPPHWGTTLVSRQGTELGVGKFCWACMTTSVQQRRALRLLADAPHGRTVAHMLAHGFTNMLLDGLACDGLATIRPGTMCTGTRRITVVWVAITEAGRRALPTRSNDTER